MARYLGSYYCDHCSHGGLDAIWLLDDGSRLCASHYRQVMAQDPPRAFSTDDLPAPPAELPWVRLLPGLRMRPSEVAQHGVELQGVRNVQLERGTETVSSGPAWTLADSDLVKLVILASPYRDADEPTKLLVHTALLRILHGKGSP